MSKFQTRQIAGSLDFQTLYHLVMKTLAIASQKGGTAKTTTAAHLGAALAERGQKILLVDMDPQGHLAESFGVPAQELVQEISQVLEQKLSLAEIVNEVRPGLY